MLFLDKGNYSMRCSHVVYRVRISMDNDIGIRNRAIPMN